MFAELKTFLSNPEHALAKDAFGVVALIVILVAGLHLPGVM